MSKFKWEKIKVHADEWAKISSEMVEIFKKSSFKLNKMLRKYQDNPSVSSKNNMEAAFVMFALSINLLNFALQKSIAFSSWSKSLKETEEFMTRLERRSSIFNKNAQGIGQCRDQINIQWSTFPLGFDINEIVAIGEATQNAARQSARDLITNVTQSNNNISARSPSTSFFQPLKAVQTCESADKEEKVVVYRKLGG